MIHPAQEGLIKTRLLTLADERAELVEIARGICSLVGQPGVTAEQATEMATAWAAKVAEIEAERTALMELIGWADPSPISDEDNETVAHLLKLI